MQLQRTYMCQVLPSDGLGTLLTHVERSFLQFPSDMWHMWHIHTKIFLNLISVTSSHRQLGNILQIQIQTTTISRTGSHPRSLLQTQPIHWARILVGKNPNQGLFIWRMATSSPEHGPTKASQVDAKASSRVSSWCLYC
jgi:hypothetical protein